MEALVRIDVPRDVLESARLTPDEAKLEPAVPLYASRRLGFGKARQVHHYRVLTLFLAFAACSCSPINSPVPPPDLTMNQEDLTTQQVNDLSVPYDLISTLLCATPACASQPCTPNCVFSPALNGTCAAPQSTPFATATVIMCQGFCGFGPDGCLRYRGEIPHCQTPCDHWSDPACLDFSPQANYQAGGAICDIAHGWFCDDSRNLADGGIVQCADMLSEGG